MRPPESSVGPVEQLEHEVRVGLEPVDRRREERKELLQRDSGTSDKQIESRRVLLVEPKSEDAHASMLRDVDRGRVERLDTREPLPVHG